MAGLKKVMGSRSGNLITTIRRPFVATLSSYFSQYTTGAVSPATGRGSCAQVPHHFSCSFECAIGKPINFIAALFIDAAGYYLLFGGCQQSRQSTVCDIPNWKHMFHTCFNMSSRSSSISAGSAAPKPSDQHDRRRANSTAAANGLPQHRGGHKKPLEPTLSTSGPSHPDHHDHQANQATVREHPAFDPNLDAKVLYKAMEGLGTHESTIIDLLTKRSINQRLEIGVAYKALYGKDILKAFKGELKIIFSGHMEDVITALFKSHELYDTELIHQAITGLSTDEDALSDIICSRSNAELDNIIRTYKLLYLKDLVADIEGHVHSSAAFKKLLIALLTGTRDDDAQVNSQQAKWDARAMYDSGPRNWAKDPTFAPIFADRSYAHLKLVFNEFEIMADADIESVLGKDLHGDVGHLLESLAKFAKNKDTYFAELLYKSFHGHLGTTNHKMLIRTVVSRCERDMVPIKKRFEEMYHRSLASVVENEISGYYRNIILALTGCHEELSKRDPTHVA